MDLVDIIQRIALTEEYLSVGERTIESQRDLVEELARDGLDTAQALDLLEQFQEIQRLHRIDHERLLSELTRFRSGRAILVPKTSSVRGVPPGSC